MFNHEKNEQNIVRTNNQIINLNHNIFSTFSKIPIEYEVQDNISQSIKITVKEIDEINDFQNNGNIIVL
jgi:hypothetical protein